MLRAGVGTALLLLFPVSARAWAQPARETPPPGAVQPLETKPVATSDAPPVPGPPPPAVSASATPGAQQPQGVWNLPHYDKGFVLVS